MVKILLGISFKMYVIRVYHADIIAFKLLYFLL